MLRLCVWHRYCSGLRRAESRIGGVRRRRKPGFDARSNSACLSSYSTKACEGNRKNIAEGITEGHIKFKHQDVGPNSPMIPMVLARFVMLRRRSSMNSAVEALMVRGSILLLLRKENERGQEKKVQQVGGRERKIQKIKKSRERIGDMDNGPISLPGDC